MERSDRVIQFGDNRIAERVEKYPTFLSTHALGDPDSMGFQCLFDQCYVFFHFFDFSKNRFDVSS